MFDETTGGQVGVERADTAGSYIIVSRRQVTALCWLLATHQVSHAVEGYVPEVFNVDDPIDSVVRLGPCVDDVRVQEILDSAPELEIGGRNVRSNGRSGSRGEWWQPNARGDFRP